MCLRSFFVDYQFPYSLRKNGFSLVVSAVGENWGYDQPTIADKWIR